MLRRQRYWQIYVFTNIMQNKGVLCLWCATAKGKQWYLCYRRPCGKAGISFKRIRNNTCRGNRLLWQNHKRRRQPYKTDKKTIYCNSLLPFIGFLAQKNNFPSLDYAKMLEILHKNLATDSFVYIDIMEGLTIDDYYKKWICRNQWLTCSVKI